MSYNMFGVENKKRMHFVYTNLAAVSNLMQC